MDKSAKKFIYIVCIILVLSALLTLFFSGLNYAFNDKIPSNILTTFLYYVGFFSGIAVIVLLIQQLDKIDR